MEVVYCAGCGRRIDAPDIQRGEVSRSGEDYFCLKCSQASGRTLEPQQPRPPGATTKAQAPRAKSARAPREVKAPNTTLVILALGAAFVGAALYGVNMVRSHGETGRTGRKRRRPVGARERQEPPPVKVVADDPQSLFGPRVRLPSEHEADFTPPRPAPAPEEEKPGAILVFDFEAGIPEDWAGELETETLPPGSTQALRASDRGGGLYYAGGKGTEKEQFRVTRGARLSFDCWSSHAVTVQLALWCESPEEKGNFWKDLAVPAEEWKRLDVRVMDLVRDESGNTVREGASCRQLKFKIFKSPPGLRLVVDNIRVREAVEELAPIGPAAFFNAGPAGELPADALAFTPSADTFVSGDSSGTALGARRTIEVGGGAGKGVRRTAYLRFEVKGLPGEVLSAKLRLYCVNPSIESGGELYAGGGGWDEAALTFDSRLESRGKPVARLGPVSIGQRYELDVSPLVRGEGAVELVLDSMLEDAAGYGSRESAHPPQLVVTCEKAREEAAPEPEPPAPADAKPVLKRIVALVREGRTEEAKEEAASFKGPVGELLRSCVEEREELAKLAVKGLVEAGRDEQLRLRFGKITLKGFVTDADGWRLWVRTPQGAAVPADVRKLSMDDVARYADVDGNSPEGARTLGRAWLVQGNAARALACLSVAKVGGVEVSAEMELARLLVEPEETQAKAPVDWWDGAWTRRRKITFHNSAQRNNLTDCPILIRLHRTRVGYARTRNAGEDVRFVDVDGETVLAHEIEKWNEAGASFVWVKVPQIDARSRTDFIWMYYGNPAAPDGQNSTGVWDPQYKGVWHLHDDSLDSTLNANHGVNRGSTDVPGKFADAQEFCGTNSGGPGEHIEIPNSPSLENIQEHDCTIEAWFRPDRTPPGTGSDNDKAYGILLKDGYHVGVDYANDNKFEMEHFLAGDVAARVKSASAFPPETYHYVVAVVSRTNGTTKIYVNGQLQGTSVWTRDTAAREYGTTPWRIGCARPNKTTYRYAADGRIDEVRISSVARSADWIAAQYKSMSDTFCTYGREEKAAFKKGAARPKKKLPRRVTTGLIAYYPFDEGRGKLVRDRSGAGTPLDLKITGAVSWLPGRNGVEISSSSIIRSRGRATKLHAAVLRTGQVTFEVWCRPANLVQTGPVRMVSYSLDASHRNFTLGQAEKKIHVRLRTTTSTNQNGAPYMITKEIVTTEETHFVVTHTAQGTKRLYKNGVEVASMARTGTMSNWNISYLFMIANEVTLDRPWLGQVYVVAVYNRELSAEEVLQNFQAGSVSAGWASGRKTGAGVLRPGKVVKRINFQPKTSQVPKGYQSDCGEVFNETRGYGWREALQKATRLRDRRDLVLGTTIFAGSAKRAQVWEMVLADGTYFLSAVCGDSQFEQGPHGVKAEGVKLVWDEITRAKAHTDTGDVPLQVRDGRLTLEVGAVGSRLIASDKTTDTGLCSLVVKEAEVIRGPDAAGRLWFAAAADATRLSGAAKSGTQYARGDDKDAARDSLEAKLVYMATKADNHVSCATTVDHACYAFRLEKGGNYHLWGRMYFPAPPGSNEPNSFWVRVDEGAPRKFGNSLDTFRKWHWGGDGEAERGRQRPVSLGRLGAGTHQLLVINRDGEGARLDVLCVSPNASYRPSDGDALKALRPSGARRRDPAAGEWTTIFNGRDLTGWRSSGKTYVEDGALVAESDGDLYHAGSWTEFVLTCDFKRSGAAGLSAIGIGLASRRFGRGQWRASARIHSDGDAHVYAGRKRLWKSGAGKFPADQWVSLKFELTRQALSLYAGGSLLGTVSLAGVPAQAGGVYFYADRGLTARFKNVRVLAR